MQRIGTAMGTMVAPTYACLFMAYLEEKILTSWGGTKPLIYKRFIDDIFIAWPGTEEELKSFFDFMNSYHSHIKFEITYNIETNTIPFLDMSVTVKNGKLVTDLYEKETAVTQYLLPSSCHPRHQWANIPYSLAYRLKRICSSNQKFEENLSNLKMKLLSRQYQPKIIDEAFNRARLVSRTEALKKVVKTTSDRPVFAITYHPGLPSVAKIVRTHWNVMIEQSNILKRVFPRPPMIAYRRAKSLKDILIRAKVSTKRKSSRLKNGYTPCKRACMCCWISQKATTHKCYRTKKVWNINAPINCTTPDVVYKLLCRKCPPWLYIGETGRRFCDRVQDHRGYITRKELDHPIGHHFNLPGHSVADLVPIAFERVLPRGQDLLRKSRESFWINQYDSAFYGANTRI